MLMLPVACAAWGAALVAVVIPSMSFATSVGAWVLAIVIAGGLVLIRRRRGGSLGTVLALAVIATAAVAMVFSAVAAKAPARTPVQLAEAASSGRAVSLVLRLDEKPAVSVPTRAPWEDDLDEPGSEERQPVRYRLVGEIVEVSVREKGRERATTVGSPVVVFAETRDVPRVGEHLRLIGTVKPTEIGDRSAYLVFATGEIDSVRPSPWYLGWAADLRADFLAQSRAVPGAGGSLLPGLAIGDTSRVDETLDSAMKASSLSHLTAVSGANCAVVVAIVMAVLALCRVRRAGRIIGSLLALGGFVILVTPEPSVIRAAAMAAVVLLAMAIGRPSAGVPVLSFVVIALLVGDPWLARSYGFALSVLATAGLLLFAAPMTRLLARYIPMPVAAVLALPLSAQAACQPVLILLDPSLPLYGIAANVLAAPAAPVATILGLIGCLSVGIPPLAAAVTWVAWLPATWIAGVALTVSDLPFQRLPWIPGIVGALLLAGLSLVAVVWMRGAADGVRSRGLVLTGLLLVLTLVVYVGTLAGAALGSRFGVPQDWRVLACDIGQGDAVLVRSQSRVALIDTGPDPKLLSACLERTGITHIDLLVLTHYDLDHVGGVAAVAGRVDTALVGPTDGEKGTKIVEALRAGGASLITDVGAHGTLGGLRWSSVWPTPHAKTMNVGNEGSVVVVFEGDGLRSIFLGDLDEQAQDALLATRRVRGIFDVVKVAHHGSADQSARFYESLHAKVAVISVGADNDYGHPTASILKTLKTTGSTVIRTDHDGMSAISVRSGDLTIWRSSPGQNRP